MASGTPGAQLRRINYGTIVQRATATLPQSTVGNLFNVVGGRVIITDIVGEVTTAIQAQADNTKLQSVPTTGPTTDMCAVLDITGLAVGTLLGITGTPATALQSGSAIVQMNEMIAQVGIVKLNCAASNTGSIKWTVTYIPFDDAGTMTAA